MQGLQPEYYTWSVDEVIKRSRFPITVISTLSEFYQRFARDIADQIKTNNAAGKPTRIIWPVGPVAQYPILVDITNRERISWKNVQVFNMDDYLDWEGKALPVDHPLSFEGFIRREFVEKVESALRPPEENLHFPKPQHLAKYSADIQSLGGIDVCYAGIAVHGHIAFNEPEISRYRQVTVDEMRNSSTRILPIAPESIIMNGIRSCGGDLEAMPPMCITVGMKDILASKHIRVYLQGGRWQQAIFRRVLFGPISVEYPATFLQYHNDVHFTVWAETIQAPVLEIQA